MSNAFHEKPVINSPYEYPAKHWELDEDGQPTEKILQQRRPSRLITPIPRPQRIRKSGQREMVYDEGEGLSSEEQQYDPTPVINDLRGYVDQWREISDPHQWGVTAATAHLLSYWRQNEFQGYRPFFAQLEAVETLIWLTEVAGKTEQGKKFLRYLENANAEANDGLSRLALKMATGAGKTTVMAMIITWQTINAIRYPGSKRFTKGFLVVTPGLTIRDRLRVLQPNDPDNYYRERELVPADMLAEMAKAKIVITNYHALKLREKMDMAKGTRSLLKGRGPDLETTETEGQMLQRVMPSLMGQKNIMVLNDEAHHCYRSKRGTSEESTLNGEDKSEAEQNNEAARLWYSGLQIVDNKLGLHRVVDLSATPFFLRGSGYAEGTLFPWTMSDFSLMDAIECGIVKLPRVPVADNIPGEQMPRLRNLWEHVGPSLPRKGRNKSGNLDPLELPSELLTALDALYGHYKKTYELWQEAGIRIPPVFIIVTQNTSISELIYKYISGFYREGEDGGDFENGRLPLFRNFDEEGHRLARPNTLLIDSVQLESGEALDNNFRKAAADEIERFRREMVERSGQGVDAESISDQELLREAMNTVGKPGRLGEQIKAVVSVSMLTEGWDANNVTHILGVRAFGTQLLAEQVVGRALRRQSYDINEDGLFAPEYADILGVPFDFTAKPVVAPPQPPRETTTVKAVSPERDELEISFPRVKGYRVELPEEKLTAQFGEDSLLELTPELVGPSLTKNAGIIGEETNLDLKDLAKVRQITLEYNLTKHLLYTHWRDSNETPKLHLFGQLKRITRRWLSNYLVCHGGTYPAQLLYHELGDLACERITAGITRSFAGEQPVKALLDSYNPFGSTQHVHFVTAKRDLWQTDARKCHINYAVLDSSWEAEFCRVLEAHPRVRSYVKNHSLGFEIPYRWQKGERRYRPDFIIQIDRDSDEPLHLVVEIKGYRGEDAKSKKEAAETYWIPAINHRGDSGTWAFAEFTDVHDMVEDFDRLVADQIAASSKAK